MRTGVCVHCGRYIYWSHHLRAWAMYNRANADRCNKNPNGTPYPPHVPK